MSMRRFVSFGPALVVLLTSVVLLLVIPSAIRRIGAARTSVAIEAARKTLGADDILERFDRANRAIADAVLPSVVHVDVRVEGGGATSGAGWVYDDLGHIVTNAHVVAGASRCEIQFADGQSLRASIVASDAFTDIAVLQVDSGPWLFPLARARDKQVQRGDRVFAFGSPFGLKFSVSEGVVSGLGRSAHGVLGFTGISNYIQTDAAVNPGNSGGPLVDSSGRLIGMNVAIANAVDSTGSQAEGQSAGISFAIPLETIESRVPQLIASGLVKPGFLGIEYSRFEEYINEPGYHGVGIRITKVRDDGPAKTGGVEVGDYIVAVNGKPATSIDVFRALIATGSPGEIVAIRVWRLGKLLDLQIKLGAASVEFQIDQHVGLLRDRMGLIVRGSHVGLVVLGTFPGSPAEQAGFEAGMVILSLNGRPVANEADLGEALMEARVANGERVTAHVRAADGKEFDLPIRIYRLPEHP